MLGDLLATHERIVANIPTGFQRYLHARINWNHRLVGIVGPRGAGKTTLVLQHYQQAYHSAEKCLYLSADHPLIASVGLYQAVAEYFKYYGECVIIDEVHKHPDWSTTVKALYDSYPGKKFIVLGSSMLNILHGKGDLSRRLLLYSLKGLSFREYLNFRYAGELPACDFDTLVGTHVQLSRRILEKHPTVLRDFMAYCATGYYPFFMQCSPSEYYQLLVNVIEKVVYEDIPSIRAVQSGSSLKMKRLLAYLSMSTIPTFNISSLTNEIDVTRDTLYEFFDVLQRAQLATVVSVAGRNVRAFKKSKILLNNPNLYYAISTGLWESAVNRGNLREAFFASQLAQEGGLHTSATVDFTVTTGSRAYEVEVGGKSKDLRQLSGIAHGLVFKDGIECGAGPQIPLYLAGFLY
jgi:predicted AAA+ superfamily ATPase